MLSIGMQGIRRIEDLTCDILSGIIDGIAVSDVEGRILVWNRAAEEMTGVSSSDAMAGGIREVFRDNPQVIGQIEKTLATGRSYSDYEAELRLRNRPPFPAAIVTSCLTDRAGDILGVILTIRDQTGVRDLKERVRRSDRLAAIGTIAAGIAHEIKNPLLGIRGAAQLMLSELCSKDTERSSDRSGLVEYVDVIIKEADRLNNVLEGMLDFTRIRPREMRSHNIHAILDRVLLLLEDTARKNSIVLIRQYDPSLPDVMGDEGQIIQVFLNIIKNAIEAMPNGGRLSVITRVSDLFTSVQTDEKKRQLMVVKIVDTGRGMSQAHLEEIFSPFFTTKETGLGLGLALSYQIVQEHMGMIRVESREGEGTTFSVYLPLAG